jgi:bleomycin hydrolase
MKNWTLALGLAFSSFFASAQVDLINKVKDNGSDGAGFKFETLIDLEATPVKNQGRSGTCWSYATTGFIESELLRMGKDPIDLSEMFTVRHVYDDKGEKYVRLHGHLNFAQGGALPDVLYVIKRYGAVPQEVYEGLNYGTEINNHGELEAILKAQLDQVIKNKNGSISPQWRKAFNATLDAYLGDYPEKFNYQGKNYSPRSFADDYLEIDPDDYVQLTSFTHHPMHEEVMIQVPDNWAWGKSYNVALDEMMAALDHGLENGFTVAWATDVSEKGFSLKNGVAIVPAKDYADMTEEERATMFSGPQPELNITPAIRQAAYDSYETTDDHGMQITGKVKDQEGNHYYIVKNSWGERDNDFRAGYINASEAFVRYKTISILLHKDGLPKVLRKKLDL